MQKYFKSNIVRIFIYFIEQGLNSAITFVFMIFSARGLSKDLFGHVSSSWQITIFLLTLANGAIFNPLVILVPGSNRSQKETHLKVVSIFKIFLVSCSLALFLLSFITEHKISLYIFGLAIACCRVAFELDRRWLIALQRPLIATGNGVIFFSAMVCALMIWWFMDPPLRHSHYFLIACFLSFFGVTILNGKLGAIPLQINVTKFKRIKIMLLRYWRLTRWTTATAVVSLLGGLAIPFLLLASIGPNEAGEFNAVRSIFGILNILIYGLVLHVAPELRKSYRFYGKEGLRRGLINWSLITVLVAIICGIFLYINASGLLNFVYGDDFLKALAFFPPFLALFVIIGPSAILNVSLNVAEKPQANLFVSAVSSVMIITLFVPIATEFGAVKACWLMVFSEAFIVLLRIYLARNVCFVGKRSY